jgi:hypothetical protein
LSGLIVSLDASTKPVYISSIESASPDTDRPAKRSPALHSVLTK